MPYKNIAEFSINEFGLITECNDTSFLVSGQANESAVFLKVHKDLGTSLTASVSFKRADGFALTNRLMTVNPTGDADANYYEYYYVFSENDRILDIAGQLEVSFKIVSGTKTIASAVNSLFVRRNIKPNLETKTEEEFYEEAMDLISDLTPLVSNIANAKADINYTEAGVSKNIYNEISNRYTKQETYTKAEIDRQIEALNTIDPNDYYTKTEVDTSLSAKANASNVYKKSETYTQEQVNNKVSLELQSYYPKGETYNKTETYSKEQVDKKISGLSSDQIYVYATKAVAESKVNYGQDKEEGAAITLYLNDFDGKTVNNLKNGAQVLIIEEDVPDYWLANKEATVSATELQKADGTYYTVEDTTIAEADKAKAKALLFSKLFTPFESNTSFTGGVDSTVTEGSENLITSGAVYTAISENTIKNTKITSTAFYNMFATGKAKQPNESFYTYNINHAEMGKEFVLGETYELTDTNQLMTIKFFSFTSMSNYDTLTDRKTIVDICCGVLMPIDDVLTIQSDNPVMNKTITVALSGKQDTLTIDTELNNTSTNLVQNKAIHTALSNKQDKLVSGNNIKTINNQSILGSGNIEISGGSDITVDTALSTTSTNPVQNKVIKSALDNKVDKVTNSRLMYNDEATKLSGIESGAQVNVLEGVQFNGTDLTISNKKVNVTIPTWATASNKPTYTKSEVGLENVTNDSQVKRSEMGVASGVATLNEEGKITASQIPDYILGQLVYGGVVNGSAIASLSNAAKEKLNTNSNTLQLINDPNGYDGPGGYTENEGIFYISSATLTFAELEFQKGDWLLAAGGGWTKIDNTDAVTGIKGNAEANYRIGNVNITKAHIGLGNVENTADANKSVSHASTAGTATDYNTSNGNIKTKFDSIDSALNGKVNAVSGKVLSSNDFTNTLLNKLNGIAEGANKTIVDAELSNFSTNPLQNKVIHSIISRKMEWDDLVDIPAEGDNSPISSAGVYNALANKTKVTIKDWRVS